MDTNFTDKYIKNNLESIEFESEDFKSTEFNNGVYNSILKLKILNETGKANVLASANFFIVNGKTTDIVDAADSESGDLYFVAESMVNYFKINQYSSIAILDNYSLFSSKATVVSKKCYLKNTYYLILRTEELIILLSAMLALNLLIIKLNNNF